MPARSKDLKTPLARLAFAQGLFQLQEDDRGKKKWSCSLLFPKSTDLTALKEICLDAAAEEWGGREKASQLIKDGIIKSPFLDGDGKQGKSKKTGEPHPGFPGTTFIRCTSGEEYQPKLYKRNAQLGATKADIYSGSYVYAVVNAFCWENKENGKGITFGISLVQAAKDGDKLGGDGGVNANDFIEAIPDEGDAPASTKTGEGAAGLFG